MPKVTSHRLGSLLPCARASSNETPSLGGNPVARKLSARPQDGRPIELQFPLIRFANATVGRHPTRSNPRHQAPNAPRSPQIHANEPWHYELRPDAIDHGCPPQSVSTLGEPFQRGNTRTRTDHVGVGFGLAIVNTIAQAHDGTLTLTPRPDGGLRVTVRLADGPEGVGQLGEASYPMTPSVRRLSSR